MLVKAQMQNAEGAHALLAATAAVVDRDARTWQPPCQCRNHRFPHSWPCIHYLMEQENSLDNQSD